MDQTLYLKLMFETKEGGKLKASTAKYSDSAGNSAAFKRLKPAYPAAVFNDIDLFIPYSEFGFAPGSHDLRVHADLLYQDYSVLSHLNYYPFKYTKSQ